MTATDPFRELLDRARQGDQDALGDLVRRYEPEVRMVARLRLGSALRPHLDSIDLVQSVHHSLMVGLRQNRFEINTPQQLVALALTIVRRKAARAWQRLKRQQRLSDGGGGEGTLARTLLDLASAEQDPAAAAQYRDAVEGVCRNLDLVEKQLLEMHLEGYRTVEIAEQLNLNADVLRVKLSRLRARLRSQGIVAEEL
jgi:RNA polymerase sigma-70 factor (ECF subfamily)